MVCLCDAVSLLLRAGTGDNAMAMLEEVVEDVGSDEAWSEVLAEGPVQDV